VRRLLVLSVVVAPAVIVMPWSVGASAEQVGVLLRGLAAADSPVVRVQVKDCGGTTRKCSYTPWGNLCVNEPNCKFQTYGSRPAEPTTNPRPRATGLKRLYPIHGGFRDRPQATRPVTPIGPRGPSPAAIPRRR
jgi:hypothetical protein